MPHPPSLRCLPLLLLLNTSLSAQTTTQPTTQPTTRTAFTPDSRRTLLSQLDAFELPPLNYSFYATRNFTTAIKNLDEPRRQRLYSTLNAFIENALAEDNSNPAELNSLVLRRYIVAQTLPDSRPIPLGTGLAPLERARHLAGLHLQFTNVEHNTTGANSDALIGSILQYLKMYPDDPALVEFLYRCLPLISEDAKRAEIETLLNHFPESPPARKLAIEKLIGSDETFPTPFDLPTDKPSLLHFYTPDTKWGEAHLPALRELQRKYKDAFHLHLIPVPKTPDAFTQSQGLTQADIPLTYILASDHTLKSIRHDTRLEKPLLRLLEP